MKSRKIIIGIAICVFAAILISIGISAVVCNYKLKVTYYDIALDGIQNKTNIVMLSDIHGKEYGENNEKLLTLIQGQEPDAIFMIGDIFPENFTELDADYVVSLSAALHEIAPVYFSMGNHETSYTSKFGSQWVNDLLDLGITVFDEMWQDVEIAGNTIRLGGSMGHGYLFGRSHDEFEASPEYAVLTALEESPHPAILLAHMPDTVALSDGKQRWHIDLVLSGHTHGGVIRIPGIGGVYAPMQGWWPNYDYGNMMLNDQMRMIITSGLSGHDKVPRIFNLPEICVIDLHN